MKKLVLLGWMGLISLSLPLVTNAQTYDWSMNIGGVGASGNDQANTVVVDASNNIIMGGYATSSPAGAVNFNPLGTATTVNITTNNDAVIAKYNSAGVLQKAFKWTATLDDRVFGVCTDATGNIYATGYGKGTVVVDPAFAVGGVAAGSGAIIVTKYPSALNTITWQFAITDGTGSSGNQGYGITSDAAGNIYVTGSFAGTNVNFNPLGTAYNLSTSGAGDFNGFVAKYNSSGILQWAFSLGSTGTDISYGIDLDAADNVYITGKFIGTVDFDPSGTTNNLVEFAGPGSGDGFVAKYNSAGVYQWAIAITGSSLQEQGRSIAVTPTGNVFVTGYFMATTAPYTYFNAAGTATLISAGGTDMFVAAYSTSGVYQWAKRAGGTTDDAGLNVTVDASGQPYVTGYISTASGTVNFGVEAVTVVGGKDAFYAKYNGADGTNLWAKGIGGTTDDTGGSIAIDGTSSIILVGGFSGTGVDFDPNGTMTHNSNGASDIFNARYTQCVAPIISTQPTAQSVCAGSPATFTVVASGGTLSYQWKLGATNVGGNSATLTIASAAAGDVGSYTCVVSNTCPASVTSTAVNLNLKTPTSISTQPSFSGPVCTGSSLNLSVVALGSNLTYQWKQGATNVGTSVASYSKPSATTADNGSYTVVVTGDCGPVTSTATAVTIGVATAITTQPLFVTTCQGTTLTLSVVATGSNLSYVWKQGATTVGTNSATYSKPSSTTADNGSYTVVVTGDCGAVTSSATTVTISTPPVIGTQPASVQVCPGSPTSLSVVATGSGTLSYVWKQGVTTVGTNSATYSIPSAAAGDAGSYTVVVTGACSPTATSSAAIVSLKTTTAITTQPTFTGPVCAGSPLTLSVVASGTNLSYVWKQGLSTVGTNSATYTKASSAISDNGNYTVVVTGDCGTVTSNIAAVTISSPPTITTQPVAQNVCSGTPATFSVVASGAGTISYQWMRGATAVGGNSATLSIPSAVAGDVGSYTVVVSNGCLPNATSSAAALTLKTATSITTQPSFTGPVCTGSPLSLSVVGAGNGALSYVWKQGATTVGTNSATFSQVSAATSDNGSYTVIVTAECGSVTSTATTVSISTPAAITTQPTNQSICSGSPVTYTVVASGTAPLTYAWKKGGAPVGTNSPTFSIASPTPANSGTYTVTVSNACTAGVTSNTVSLNVGTTTAITTQPNFTGTVCQGSTLTLNVVAAGTNLTYQWKQGTTNVGTSSATYTKASSTTADNGSYTVVVTGDCGAVTSTATTVTISTPPSITTQPTNESICSGSPASFTVAATGTAPLVYTWKKGVTTVGTNSPTFTIVSPVAGDAGSYSVVISNVCTPNATSNTVTLGVGTTTAISTHPTFTGPLCQGSALSLSVVATGSNLSYQWKQGATNVGTSTATYSKASSTTTDNGSYTVVVTGDCGVVTSTATTVTISTPPSITTQPQASNACPGTAATFTVVASGTGLSYQWVKGGSVNVGSNAATYTIPSVVAGDAGNYTVVITGSCSPAVTSNSVALTVGGSPVINTQPLSQSVCVGTTTTLSVVASGSGLTYQWKKGGFDIAEFASTLVIDPTAVADAGSYTVAVSSGCGSILSSAAVLTVKTLPSITTQPTAQVVCDGSALTISVLGSGSSLTYQWRKGGSDISLANAATYTVPAATAADAGSYTVLISNGCAPDVLSNAVPVTINSLPAITVQPVNVSVCATGQAATFNVTATGTGLSYQWKKNGTTNVGANSDTYTIGSVLVGDVGNYSVIVSGTCPPPVTSNTVTLSITPGTITVVTQPVSQTLCVGDNLDLVVSATGPSLSYQWKKGVAMLSDGGSISGTGTTNLTITSVALGDAGNYTCDITSGCAPSVSTSAAVITVSTCTGVMAQQGNNFYVSPNPGTDNFYLNAEGIADGEASITVMNTLGHEVWRGNVMISGGKMQQLLPVELSSGMYTVILSSGDNRYSTKMVVQQ